MHRANIRRIYGNTELFQCSGNNPFLFLNCPSRLSYQFLFGYWLSLLAKHLIKYMDISQKVNSTLIKYCFLRIFLRLVNKIWNNLGCIGLLHEFLYYGPKGQHLCSQSRHRGKVRLFLYPRFIKIQVKMAVIIKNTSNNILDVGGIPIETKIYKINELDALKKKQAKINEPLDLSP